MNTSRFLRSLAIAASACISCQAFAPSTGTLRWPSNAKRQLAHRNRHPSFLAAETTKNLVETLDQARLTIVKSPPSDLVLHPTSATTEEESRSNNPFLSFVQGQDDAYLKGFLTIFFVCLLNASSNPLWHSAFMGAATPPPLAINAAIAVTALIGLVIGRPLLEEPDVTFPPNDTKLFGFLPERTYAGMELGFWKFLGTTAHVYGLSLTSSDHGAFLIQLTTLIVPVIQGLRGVRIPRQIQFAVALAMAGVAAFTQDGGDAASAALQAQVFQGDLLCVAAAFFYSLYDIQTFSWGAKVPRAELVTTKVGTQATLSVGLLLALAWPETLAYWNDSPNLSLIPVVLYSGLVVNALATFLQVKGMVAVGPVRAQLIFASQPLWSAGLAYAFLHETVGAQGAAGGLAFFAALYLAATAPKEDAEEEGISVEP